LRIDNFFKKNNGAVRLARNDIDINDDFNAKLFFGLTARVIFRRNASLKIRASEKKNLKKLKIKNKELVREKEAKNII
jgi:hypothetical protein